MQDLSDHPFSPENVRRELGEDSPSDIAWEKWVKRVEQLLDLKSLDGTEAEDGYSLDFAFEAFERGETAEHYADTVRKKQRLNRDVAEMTKRFEAGEFAPSNLALLTKVGTALFGARNWHAGMAMELEIGDRAMRRIVKREQPCPDFKAELIEIVERKQAFLQRKAAELTPLLNQLRA